MTLGRRRRAVDVRWRWAWATGSASTSARHSRPRLPSATAAWRWSRSVTMRRRSPRWCSCARTGTCSSARPPARRGIVQPDRVAREFKRQLGDSVPRILGGEEFPVERLSAPAAVGGRHRRGARGWRAGPAGRDLPGQLGSAPPGEAAGRGARVGRRSGHDGHRTSRGGRSLRLHRARGRRRRPAGLRPGRGHVRHGGAAPYRDGVRAFGAPEGIDRLGGVDFDDGCSATSWPASAAPPNSIPKIRRSLLPRPGCAASAPRPRRRCPPTARRSSTSHCRASRPRCGSPVPSSRTWCGPPSSRRWAACGGR